MDTLAWISFKGRRITEWTFSQYFYFIHMWDNPANQIQYAFVHDKVIFKAEERLNLQYYLAS